VPDPGSVLALGGDLPAGGLHAGGLATAGTATAGLVLGGGLVIGLATVAGAWLARRDAARREVWLGAATGALLVIVTMHLLPDAWSAARQAAMPVWLVAAVAIVAFTLAGAVVRRGCACQADREAAGGTGTAAALAGHRLLEGAALALSGSVTVAVALAVHALAEGLAVGTLLGPAPRRRALWLTAMCASPVAGSALAGFWQFPPAAQPVLLAIAAGVLGQAARISLTAAFRRSTPAGLAVASPAAATLLAAAGTALAVHGVG
jgi:hypothetical protein